MYFWKKWKAKALTLPFRSKKKNAEDWSKDEQEKKKRRKYPAASQQTADSAAPFFEPPSVRRP
jgi:hypothetical protein